ncbi:MAG: hypothetical protein JXR51_03135 [Bacteroidales bacterium]|nr:hypothetical protein [Bacteroidales bacterium]MBN2756145.1 hypothetical protein [Bacteroidales bacterium]
MALPSLFKIPGHKKFEFKARYYDADKEELELRIEKAKREVGASKAVDENGKYVQNIKGQMKRYIDKPIRSVRSKAKRNSNYRLLIILVILSMIAYFMFYR